MQVAQTVCIVCGYAAEVISHSGNSQGCNDLQGVESNFCISSCRKYPFVAASHMCCGVSRPPSAVVILSEACSVSRQATFPLTQEVPLE